MNKLLSNEPRAIVHPIFIDTSLKHDSRRSCSHHFPNRALNQEVNMLEATSICANQYVYHLNVGTMIIVRKRNGHD